MNVRSLSDFIDSTAEIALQTHRIAGLSIAVAQDDRLIYSGGYGYADLGRRIRASARTVYGVGSITKQFTAVSVMQLVEQRTVELDDRLSKYVPGCGSLQTPVTIRHLLNHTAGIRGEADLGMLAEESSDDSGAKASIIGLVNDELFDSPPGRVWRYSNFGYCLLGLLIESVTGDSYANYIEENVLRRAGLAATWYGAIEIPSERFAHGYADQAGRFATVKTPSAEQAFSSGALYSTVDDMLRWQTALTQGHVIRPDTYERMTAPGKLENGEQLGYGYGFFLASCGGYREMSHDGTTGGYSSQLAYYPAPRLVVVVLTNSESHIAEGIEKRITRHLLGIEEPKVENLALSSSELAAYAGNYLYRGLPIPVYVQAERLMLRTPGRKVVRLVYDGDHTYRQEDDGSVCFEFAVHSGRVESFVVSREGKTLALVRRLS